MILLYCYSDGICFYYPNSKRKNAFCYYWFDLNVVHEPCSALEIIFSNGKYEIL